MVPHDKDSWSLQFVLALKLYASMWRPKYEMTLESVPLQPIDILAAQVRDVQDELAELRRWKGDPVALNLELSSQTQGYDVLKWKINNSVDNTPDRFVVDSKAGKIRFLEPGTYQISLAIAQQRTYDYTCSCEIQRCGASVATLSTNLTGTPGNASFVQVIQMKANQDMAVVNTSNNHISLSSTMTIFRFCG